MEETEEIEETDEKEATNPTNPNPTPTNPTPEETIFYQSLPPNRKGKGQKGNKGNQGNQKLKWVFLLLYGIFFSWFNGQVLSLGYISGDSMEPTLKNGQFVLIYKWNYQVKQGDVVITNTKNPMGICLTKRVIACQGETLTFTTNTLSLNGIHQGEPYLKELPHYPVMEIPLSENQVFLMGDNRNYSTDSRFFGSVPVADIVGLVLFF